MDGSEEIRIRLSTAQLSNVVPLMIAHYLGNGVDEIGTHGP